VKLQIPYVHNLSRPVNVAWCNQTRAPQFSLQFLTATTWRRLTQTQTARLIGASRALPSPTAPAAARC
jgi:hypothetical protein